MCCSEACSALLGITITVCCSVLQYSLLCVAWYGDCICHLQYIVLQHIAAYCSTLQHVVACCSVLQCVAVSCNVLQYVAVCCGVAGCCIWLGMAIASGACIVLY